MHEIDFIPPGSLVFYRSTEFSQRHKQLYLFLGYTVPRFSTLLYAMVLKPEGMWYVEPSLIGNAEARWAIIY